MIKITPSEIKSLSKFIYDVSGIHLDHNKSYLFETRLNSIAEETGCKSYQELHLKAKSDRTKGGCGAGGRGGGRLAN